MSATEDSAVKPRDFAFPGLVLTAWLLISICSTIAKVWINGATAFEYLATRQDMYLVRASILLLFQILAVSLRFQGRWFIVSACGLMIVVLFAVWMANSIFQMRDLLLLCVSALLLIPAIWMQGSQIGQRLFTKEAVLYWIIFLGIVLIFVVPIFT